MIVFEIINNNIPVNESEFDDIRSRTIIGIEMRFPSIELDIISILSWPKHRECRAADNTIRNN
jgi:hypothetical protein